MKLFFHTELFCLNRSGGNFSSCDVILIFSGPFLEVPLATKEILQSNVCNCWPCSPKPSMQLASRAQWLSWLLLYFSGYFLASLWSLFHCQPARELSGTDILTNKMTLWKTDPGYWHISKTDGDLGKKGKKRKGELFWKDWHGSPICIQNVPPFFTTQSNTNFNLNNWNSNVITLRENAMHEMIEGI